MSVPQLTPGLIHKVLYGYPSGGAEPKVIKVVKKIANAMGDLLSKQGTHVRRQITIEGQKAGLIPATYPYLYYLLDVRDEDWPPMSEGKRSHLFLFREILRDSAEIPAYRHLLRIPPTEQEALVDDVLIALAKWGFSILIQNFAAYNKMLKKNLWAATADPQIKGMDDLGVLVVKMVKRNPGYYSSGLVTKAFFDSLFDHIV